MKEIIMINKGNENDTLKFFTFKGIMKVVRRLDGKEIFRKEFATAEEGNRYFIGCSKKGWEVERKAPTPKWHFPNGEFNYDTYIETAELMGIRPWICGGQKKLRVSKETKKEIYLAMGAYYG